MQICKLFPFVKCQKNTCKSLALALSCQLALLKGGDKWQSIKQHAFKERGDLFQNCSFRGSFNNISKTGSQPHFFPLAVMNTQLCYSSLPPPVKWTGITKLMKKTSIFFFFSLSFSFLFNCFSLFLSFFFGSKVRPKNVKRQRIGVLRSFSNLRRRLQEMVPNWSVYPWVSAQCRLTYFNYGLWVCCTPWGIHNLGLTGEPKLSGGIFCLSCMLMGSTVLRMCLSPPASSSGSSTGFFAALYMLRSQPGGQWLSAWRPGHGAASPGGVHQDLQDHPLIRMSLNSCHVVLTFCHNWQWWD